MPFRPHIGSVAFVAAPGAPSISGAPTIGGTLTITPGAGPAPTSFHLIRDGVDVGVVANGYTYVAEDVGPAIAVDPYSGATVGTRSNTLQYTPSLLDNIIHWSETRNAGNTIVSGKYDLLLDLSSSAKSLTALSASARPTVTVEPLLSGQTVAVFDGVDDGMKNVSVTRPQTIIGLIKRGADANDFPIVVFFNGTAYTYIAKSNTVSGAIRAYPNGAVSLSPVVSIGDGYYHPFVLVDDGANPVFYIYGSDFVTQIGSATVANATARPASPGQISIGSWTDGTVPTDDTFAFLLATSDVLTLNERLSALCYLSHTYSTQALPTMEFVGTRTTQADAQPRPYPLHHEGEGGNTIQTWGWRMVGVWTGSNTTLGAVGDPGVGNRGAIEALRNAGNDSMIVVCFIGASGPSSGLMDQNVRRIWSVGQGAVKHILVLSILPAPGLGDPTARDQYNSEMPAVIAAMQGDGISVEWLDITPGFNAGTDLVSDNIHLSTAGAAKVSGTLTPRIIATSNPTEDQLVLSGHSQVEGGPTHVPAATAQIRPYVARDLAVAGW